MLSHQKFKCFNDTFLPAFTKLRQWFKNIQHQDITLDEARAYFKAVQSSPMFKGHLDEFDKQLRPDHQLVVSPEFESAVVKIIWGEPENVLEKEAKFCDGLLKTNFKHLYPDADDSDTTETTDKDENNEDDANFSPTKLAKQYRTSSGGSKKRSRRLLTANTLRTSHGFAQPQSLLSSCSRCAATS